jgi:glycosyltransferase involved in cell wall biosynthesis
MLHWPPELIFLSEAERLGWVDGRRGRVIPNFVNFSRFNSLLDQQQARRELRIRDDDKVVLYFGGFSVVKGIFPLLQALARVKLHEPGLTCLMPGAVYESPLRWQVKLARTILPVVGLGTHVQRVNKLIKSLGLETSCIRTGFVSHIEKLIAACDLVVFPALTNHFARPVVEAAAMGKPVVASRFPILEELVQHEETGLLVTPGDPIQLADAILALLRVPEKRIRFGERGREIARSKYDACTNTHAIMQVYDEILGLDHRTGH